MVVRQSSSSTVRCLAVTETPITREAVAPPVVILHGLLGQARNFRSWAASLVPALSQPRRVICLDLVNHGDSFSRPTMSYKEMAEDVVNTMDSLGLDRAALVGHSMGGKVAMMAAFQHPDRIERLCVLDMAPAKYSTADGSNWRSNRQLVQALADLDIKNIKDRRAADAQLAQSVLDPNIRAFALSNLYVDKNKNLAWKCDLHSIIAHLDSLASWDADEDASFQNPSFFLAGANSRYIRSIHLPDIEKAFPNFSLRTVKDAGHWVHAEKPRETMEYTRDFLDAPVA